MPFPELTLPRFDKNKAIFEASRTLCAPIDSGNVTLDTPYGGNSSDPLYARWLWVGVSGDITFVKWNGETQLLKNAVAGVWHPMCSVQINTGTTATDLVWGN